MWESAEWSTPHPETESMSAVTAKEKALEAVEGLPADATLEDAMERLYFLYKVERGLAEADAGEIVTHEQAKAERERWPG